MMTTTKEFKNVTKSLKKVKNTLFEMLGPQSDGFEESKLSLLLGIDSCGNLNGERERLKKIQTNSENIGEDSSAAECNISGKEISKKFEEFKHLDNFTNVEDSSLADYKQKDFKEENSFDCNFNRNQSLIITKSAFRAIKEKNTEHIYSNLTNSFYSTQIEGGLNICQSEHTINSFTSGSKFNPHPSKSLGHEGNSNVYSLNLTTNNYNHTNSNNYQNNNFHNNSSSKQILFTSIKNNHRREKKLANQVNFQIIKTNQSCETAHSNENRICDNATLLDDKNNNDPNINNENSHDNSMALAILNTNFSLNAPGSSAFKRSNNSNLLNPHTRDSMASTELRSIPPQTENLINNSETKVSKLQNGSCNLLKENSNLKYLIIAAETFLAKGLQFLQDTQIKENCTSSFGINLDPNNFSHKANENTEENLNLNAESSENNESHSAKCINNINFKTSAKDTINMETTESTRKCDNKVCGVVESKDLGWFKVKMSKSRYSWLCRGCYKAWKNNQFCYYCNVIYRDNANTSNYNDNKSWIQCDFCEMWQHIQCEEAKGFYTNLSGLNSDPNFKYICPLCRCKNENVNHDNPNNMTKDKRKIKGRNKKPLIGSNHDLLGHKTRPERNIECNQVNAKKTKKKDINCQINDIGLGGIDINATNSNGVSSHSLFSSYDNRDIYHDLYRISAINDEKKK